MCLAKETYGKGKVLCTVLTMDISLLLPQKGTIVQLFKYSHLEKSMLLESALDIS